MERRAGRTPAVLQRQIGAVNQSAIVEIPPSKDRPCERAIQVFSGKGRGLTDIQIGNELGISVNTVKEYGVNERARLQICSTIGVIASMASEGYITPAQLTEGLDFTRYSQLTDREREILDLMSQEDMWDKGNKEVAHRLNVAMETIKNHMASIFPKLGVKNRTQAVTYNLFMPQEYRIRKQEGKPILSRRESPEERYNGLTTMERLVLESLLDLSLKGNNGIAQSLRMAELTVAFHLGNIYRKLDVSDRTQAAVFELVRQKKAKLQNPH